MAVVEEKGTISIHTENIFPIIKKFLYSDHEIFLRELVSNAVDATQKLKRLASIGEFQGELGELGIKISINEKLKTITISDRGIGMTADEIKKYINQIAFSGASEFLEKYKDKGEESQIIGFFGLGFYSAFMVAKKVEIITLSHQEGAEPARWSCDGSTQFEISKAVKKDRGTDITLHLAEDSEEFLQEYRVRQILDKYCKFLPVPVIFGQKEESITNDQGKEIKVKKDDVINNTAPLWTKTPADLNDEDYLKFYKELYPFSEDPLFWIHLNVDYPFNLTGILYFPKIKNELELQKNKIQLYSRQVFITDEVKDVVPEFLMLLHGVIDSPDIPLNVSRSYLQSDSNVKKINNHITKKVADKLNELYNKDRKAYEAKWDDIGIFVKYGIISEEKFAEKAKDFALLKNTTGEYYTLEEYENKVKDLQTDKSKNVVFLYTNDPAKQDAFIESANKRTYDVLVMNGPLDSHFINHQEMKNNKVSWKRVDSDTGDKLIDKDEKKESVLNDQEKETVKQIFEKAINDKGVTVNVESLSPDDLPVTLTMPEFMRRMKDMSMMGGGMAMMGSMPDQFNAAVNANHIVVTRLLKKETEEEQVQLAKQAYDLALLSQNRLTGNALTSFIKRSLELLKQ
jgi:molecular chaperone HtpG